MVVELYRVQIGNEEWLFTSAQADVVYQGRRWATQPIERSGNIEQSDDPLKVETSFDVAAGSELADIALNPPLNIAPKLTILRSEGLGYETVFTGRIMAGVWNEGWVKVEVAPVQTELQVTGLVEVVSPQCRYTPGSRKCGLTLQGTNVSVKQCKGALVTFNESLPLHYQFGYLRQGQNHYFIDQQTAKNQVSLLHPALIAVGSTLQIVQGCDRTLQCCAERFNNAANFGGAANLPTKNPYVGDPIDR
ncbi:phage BR0599 family protein [Thaumasiovibrio subtropicus]|uniref:phage BR0599 family protein n=1 Tax=Thaumasiovibrio subtropicus TaxID=1891207 RepID=UPI000B34CE27|nr:phage BR0599 family protein [Thaumasiovibrio subtropicus]